MARMRDGLIHGYFGVDYGIVWDVVVNEVPQVRHEGERLIATFAASNED